MTTPLQNIRRLLGVIALDQTYIEFAVPIITLIFFDSSSRLFPAETPIATRSMWYGTCISIPFFINLFFAPLLSTLSDEFGRRKFLLFEIFSAFFYMLFAGLGVITGKLWLLIAGFVVRGAFSRTNTTALAMIGDSASYHQKMKYMSYLQLAISIGACAGPIISGFFAERFFFDTLNFSLPFFIAACLALINSILAYFYISETLQTKSSDAWQEHTSSRLKANLLSIKSVAMNKKVLITSLLLLCFQIGWSMYYQFIPPILKTIYHFNPHTLGIFIGMIAFWLIIGSGPAFKLIYPAFNHHAILNISLGIELVGIFITLAAYFHLLPDVFIWVGAMPIAIGDVLAYICLTTLYSNFVADHMQGKVMGINFLVVGLAWGCTGFIGGFLSAYSLILPLIVGSAGIVVAFFIINLVYAQLLEI